LPEKPPDALPTFHRKSHLMTFKNLKSGLNGNGEKFCLEIDNLILLPVTKEIENQIHIIRRMSYERNFYSTNFFSQKPVTEQSTLTYLRGGAISDDSRILFLIRNKQGMLVGQVGFKNLKGFSTELDAVIKYRNSHFSMYRVIQFLLNEIRVQLQIKFVSLEVRSDNKNAILLYEKLGFALVRQDSQEMKCVMRLTFL